MSNISLTDASADLTPVASSERIQALDVVRGFALIGIFLMNVEYYNRPLAELGEGLPAMTGLNWLAGWLVYVLVQGKFWTMFSLLFGMGFAVMLTRAERAQRNFIRPYLRRIAALAVFGALHHIFIWGGDILFSYAVGAVGLLVLLYGRARYILIGLILLVGLSFAPGMEGLRGVAGSLAFISVTALFLRGERWSSLFGTRLPTFSKIFVGLGAVLLLAAAAFWIMPNAPKEARIPMTIMSIVVLAIGWLSARFHDPADLRPRRLGVAMYLFPFIMMTTFGIVQYYSPVPAAAPVAHAASAPAAAYTAMVKKADGKPTAAEAAAKKTAEARESRAKQKKERQEQIARERRIYSQGTYAEAVRMRAGEFAAHAADEAGFALVIIGMFLTGSWFVRSGVMENTGANLPFFRKLALYGIPFGVGLGLLGTLIATAQTPGVEKDPYQIATGLMFLGNLPACLGYVSLIVLMLHSRGMFSRISVLAPVGRMALTNYLTHSVLGTLVFYGYGLGYWGTGRAWQVVFVAVVIFLQVLFCTWWLKRFRYGPMEWLWRCITYWRITPIRRDDIGILGSRQVLA